MANQENLHKIRHSLAHIMAIAIKQLKPEASFGVGPAIENGFYYDVLVDKNFTEEDLSSIQAGMQEIIAKNLPFEHETWPIDKAIEYFESNKQQFKVELLKDLKTKGSTAVSDAGDTDLIEGSRASVTEVSIYKTGDFIDLCRGPHVASTSAISPNSFKLNKLSGVYWRGKETNPQMQRLYGLAFESAKELGQHLNMMQEAEARDHRKLGAELDLFVFSDLVGSGLPLFTPRGTVLRDLLNDFSQSLRLRAGFEKVWVPHIAKTDLYKFSGHWDKFGDELFLVKSQESSDEFALKPMNCPHHAQIFASKPRSYRDLPVKYLETTTVYRDEKKGELQGLSRVRSVTQDDSHVFCRPQQVEEVLGMLLDITKEFYRTFDMDFTARLSLRDDSDTYLGDKDLWKDAEMILRNVSSNHALEYYEETGEAAFYGPKIDFMAKDSIGRTHQVATAQLDFVQPERFGLSYTDSDGSDQVPMMVHFASLGSIERFLSVYIEHTAGAFPLWLAPEQVRVIPISEKFDAYGQEVLDNLLKNGVRASLDNTSESLGKRILGAEKLKVPYLLIVGQKEQEAGSVAVRKHSVGDQGPQALQDTIKMLLADITNRQN
ncbi:threonine--tRNA ligase [Candidatus Saccharibacteria bacterium]|nr:threonine--tRNA ligase [Candidatus Saccharibacteria bacterium]